MKKKPNEAVVALILQCLDEDELRYGSIAQFARMFQEFSGQYTSRATLCNWLYKNGMPLEKCGIAEAMSRTYTKGRIILLKDFRSENDVDAIL
jgi:hypothetical protein